MNHEIRLLGEAQARFSLIKEGRDPYPFCVEIHPTDVCNQGCDYCFHGGNGFGKDRNTSKYMTIEQYRTLFKNIQELGIQNISISGGGEPFLHGQIGVILESAINMGLKVRIVTNGNFIPSETVPALMGCEELRVSLDTVDSGTYSHIRKVKPELLSQTLDSLRCIKHLRDTTNSSLQIGTTCIIGPANYDKLEAFAEHMLSKVGVDTVVFKHDAYGKYEVDPIYQDSINTQLLHVKHKYGHRIEHRGRLEKFERGGACAVPYSKCVVNPYGDLYSCCLGSQPGEVNGYFFGSVREKMVQGETNAFKNVWQNSARIRAEMIKAVKCSFCNYSDRMINQLYSPGN